MSEKKPHTHIAYVLKRESRLSWRWLEIGEATRDEDGKGFQVNLDRLPTGGFSGRFRLRENTWKPPTPGAADIASEEAENL